MPVSDRATLAFASAVSMFERLLFTASLAQSSRQRDPPLVICGPNPVSSDADAVQVVASANISTNDSPLIKCHPESFMVCPLHMLFSKLTNHPVRILDRELKYMFIALSIIKIYIYAAVRQPMASDDAI
jgi:hypothetical protein